MATTIRYKLRNDTGTNWTSKNPILAQGEPGYDSTENRFKVGNGVDTWNDLPYLKDDDTIVPAGTSYTHPSYTARTGQPTTAQSPVFGGSFTVSQVTSDSTGHVTGMTNRTITIPSAAATTSTAGLMSAADKSKLDGMSEGATATSNYFRVFFIDTPTSPVVSFTMKDLDPIRIGTRFRYHVMDSYICVGSGGDQGLRIMDQAANKTYDYGIPMLYFFSGAGDFSTGVTDTEYTFTRTLSFCAGKQPTHRLVFVWNKE